MKRLILSRFCHAPNDMGTFGRLWFEDAPDKFWWTVERSWHNNAVDISCIPTGVYQLRHGFYSHNGDKNYTPYPDLEFVAVPGRANIEIHRANQAHELKGCIAPGKGLALSDWAVRDSTAALNEILAAVEGETDIHIAIFWQPPMEEK